MSFKNEIRLEIKNKFLSISQHEINEKTLLIQQLLNKQELFQKAKKIGLFMPIEFEPKLVISKDKKVYIPFIKNEILGYGNISKGISVGTYGILEPKSKKEVNIFELDIILVPLVGFNEKLYRLGRGKGFYDKTFVNIKSETKRPVLWGVGFEMQKTNLNFQEKHDAKLDKIFTETKIYE
ncbi:5-formyltetrahydrofolate cyclo-ligase [SAR86 cluster bacterium]|jgi:5-formyltetrahydrofolate cyclo-ligase|uniref:5-formyltetrahydrofolate cyclo-ligase n=1 Tax=SAR86 cluster bacterium TaxID=2030880 RepID=A0A9Q8X221_9GAMM|nr:5-formyltetrahydrofolate cyclo-ligase [SAR86 cluster bacterium]